MTTRPGKIAIFEQFRADGITRMFGNPGTVEQGFLDTLEHIPDFDYVMALQEAVAVGIADGYARASGGPALVQLHSGVGLGNGIGMLYQAMRGHSPLVVIAGDAGVRYDAMDAQMAAELVGMARPVTKWATRVTHPGSVLRVLRRAVKTAMTPPRGPVFVALPMDVLDAVTDEPVVRSTIPTRSVLPTDVEIGRAVEILRHARRPVILMGDGVSVSGAQAELAAVAEALCAPVWGVDDSELNMDNLHPLYRGSTGHMFGADSPRAVRDADAVLAVGTYLFPEVFPSLRGPFHEDARIVHIDLDDYEIAKNFPVDVALVADPAPTLRALRRALVAVLPDSGSWQVPESPVRQVVDHDAPMIEHFAAALAQRAPEDLVVFDEALTASPGLLRRLPPRRPGSYFRTRGGCLGTGIPGAVGAKLARPAAEVVGFTGDGASMYTFQALWTATRHDVAAKFVVCDNHRYELLDHNIERYWRERSITPHGYPSGFDLSRPEIGFVALADSLGVEAVRVDKKSDVEDAVDRMLAHQGPFLVDLVTA
jgi:benzoylformate decarboxylase